MAWKTPSKRPEPGFESELEHRRAIVTQIHELLERAEYRRRNEPHRRRKWDKVLDNLERGLAEARARVAVLEPLAEAAASVNSQEPPDTDAPDGDTPAEDAIAPSPPPQDASCNLPSAPASSLRLLDAPFGAEIEATLKELSQGQAHVPSVETGEGKNEADWLLDTQIESLSHSNGTTNAAQESGGKSTGDREAERRRQTVLSGAIEKLKKGAFATLSFEEAELALSCYTLLETRLFLNERDARLKVILKQGLSGIARHSERLAELVRDAYKGA